MKKPLTAEGHSINWIKGMKLSSEITLMEMTRMQTFARSYAIMIINSMTDEEIENEYLMEEAKGKVAELIHHSNHVKHNKKIGAKWCREELKRRIK